MNKQHINSLLYLIILIFICFISYRQITTPEPALPGYTPDSYSAYRAIEHLKIIARAPHSGGTTEHKKVRNFIYDFCKSKGLETKVLSEVGLREFGSSVYAGNTYNILARLKGSNNSKAILVMAHYDSQPNTPGAADDGSGVASMLETIDLLSKAESLKNDVYFLFTDLEEIGLLGAEAFVSSYPQLEDIGLLLNFEARGNDGISFTFETSSENGWVIRQLAQASNHVSGNSLAYEIYKLMPNDSDFTMFRNSGISGLNSAFIDGYSYYHSAVDNAQNINLGSLQHQGDIMWDFINHFGNIDLTDTKSKDVIFFNIFSQIIIFPSSFDWPLIAFALILFLFTSWRLYKLKELTLIGIAKGSLSYVLAIISAMLLVWGLNYLIIILNPHYESFYSSNFYNSTTYLWVFIGCVIVAFGIVYNHLFKKSSVASQTLGGLFIHVILILVLKQVVPTGAFIIYIPLIIYLIILNIKVSVELPGVLNFGLSILIPLVLWVPFVYLLFVVFSLSLPFASAFFMVLMLPYLLDMRSALADSGKYLMPSIGLTLIIIALVIGQLTRTPNKEQPQQTMLTYGINAKKNEAYWLSRQKLKDEFLANYIKSDLKQEVTGILPNTRRLYWKDSAPVITTSPAKVSIESDTTILDTRSIKVKIKPQQRDVTYLGLLLSNNAHFLGINERALTSANIQNMWFYAPKKSGDEISINLPADEKAILTVIESKIGIDKNLLTTPLPDDFIHGTGSMSNNMLTTQVINL